MSAYLDHDGLTRRLHDLAAAHPTFIHVRSIGKSPEGRDIWWVIVGPDPDRVRPTAWIDGNVHASELAGSAVALAIVEQFLAVHLGTSDLPAHQAERIREILLFAVPRISPDGAEQVLRTGQYVRSIPRDRRCDRSRPRWRSHDLDGDGLSLVMRRQDPCGEFVESREVPNLMVLRSIEDEGPFYRLWPEGTIENWDGDVIPDPGFLAEFDTDLNRNFPYDWWPEPKQIGAGRYPGSEPESRAVIELACAHPEIFCWLDLHTFGGCFIRPLGDGPDTSMDGADLALFRQLGRWTEELVGYPTVSGYEEFVYAPNTPTRGDINEFAYRQRGAIALTCEIWDLFRQVGLQRKRRFVDEYTQLDRGDMEAIGRWDRDHNGGRVVRPWVPVEHGQLGPVEVGGLDIRYGISNPPPERLGEVCAKIAAFWLRVASLAPALRVEHTRDGDSLRITVRNEGYLPTNALSSAKILPHVEPLWLELTGDVTGAKRHALGHLDGWGRGLHDGTDALYFQRGRGNGNERVVRVAAKGPVTVRVGSCRVGWITREIG